VMSQSVRPFLAALYLNRAHRRPPKFVQIIDVSLPLLRVSDKAHEIDAFLTEAAISALQKYLANIASSP